MMRCLAAWSEEQLARSSCQAASCWRREREDHRVFPGAPMPTTPAYHSGLNAGPWTGAKQGKTTRWAIAWSFSTDGMTDEHKIPPKDKVFARKQGSRSRREVLKFGVSAACCPADEIWPRILEFLDAGWPRFSLASTRDRQNDPAKLCVQLTSSPGTAADDGPPPAKRPRPEEPAAAPAPVAPAASP